MHYVIMTSSLS